MQNCPSAKDQDAFAIVSRYKPLIKKHVNQIWPYIQQDRSLERSDVVVNFMMHLHGVVKTFLEKQNPEHTLEAYMRTVIRNHRVEFTKIHYRRIGVNGASGRYMPDTQYQMPLEVDAKAGVLSIGYVNYASDINPKVLNLVLRVLEGATVTELGQKQNLPSVRRLVYRELKEAGVLS